MSNHTIAAPITNGAEARTTDHEVLNRADNAVCRRCSRGWLEDLENEATAVIHELTVGNEKLALSENDVRVLGFWAYVRALLL